jgi:hypothetical protein
VPLPRVSLYWTYDLRRQGLEDAGYQQVCTGCRGDHFFLSTRHGAHAVLAENRKESQKKLRRSAFGPLTPYSLATTVVTSPE